jgi:cobalt-zinc-cadmium efflux system membrane fusion protein
VPRTALQDAKGVQVVFVPISDTEFETRRVRTAPGDGDLVQVMSGVDPGERVVTTGSFLLKTETLKGSIGAGCCEAPGGER